MRLLFDQNISFRVVKQLKTTFPAVIGIRECGLFDAYQIWEYARQNDYTFVTFGKDIPVIVSVKGFPPKVIWLRMGNLGNSAIVSLFMDHLEEFVDFINNKRKGCLMVYPDSTPDNQITEE